MQTCKITFNDFKNFVERYKIIESNPISFILEIQPAIKWEGKRTSFWDFGFSVVKVGIFIFIILLIKLFKNSSVKEADSLITIGLVKPGVEEEGVRPSSLFLNL